MKDLMGMMKQAQQLQSRFAEMQQELESLEISGSSGGGLVTVTVNGRGELRGVKIDPSLMKPDETEIVEDLIVAATNDAKGRVETEVQSRMKDLTGGLPLPPGLKLF